MNKSVLIVAAGSGSRMRTSIPKQFLLLNDKPLLMHTLQRFYEYDPGIRIFLILPDDAIDQWNELVKKYSFNISHTIVSGGKTRYESVKEGLSKVNETGIIAVHDGVRPLCSTLLIDRCFSEAEKFSNAIPVIGVTESMRETKNGNNRIIDREYLKIVQTPQCFDTVKLKKAYENTNSENFTDDASVFESNGNNIHLVEGEKSNIKITVPEDFIIASALEKAIFVKNKRM